MLDIDNLSHTTKPMQNQKLTKKKALLKVSGHKSSLKLYLWSVVKPSLDSLEKASAK